MKDKKEIAKYGKEHGYDTAVQCSKCGRIQWLEFKYGLSNGWSMCHGLTMPIIWHDANIDEAVKFAINKSNPIKEK